MKYIIQSPLDQFEIRDLFSLDILNNIHLSLTNIGLYLVISSIIIFTLSILSTNYNRLVSNSWSLSGEMLYSTVLNITSSQISNTKGQAYFPFIYILFMFILVNNFIGLVPYSFATTSHLAMTLAFSFSIVLGATILGLVRHGLKFFSLFVPAGTPLILVPLLVLIEFVSYLARNISLGLRLGANICAGHLLLIILSGFTYSIMASGIVFFIVGLLPLAFIIAFSGLEFAIAVIQAQVFVVLTCSYIKDAVYLH